MSLLFSEAKLGPLTLQNHMVMCPLTRSRALGNVPNDLMAEYYSQRASAGLIITEGTSPSPNHSGMIYNPSLWQTRPVIHLCPRSYFASGQQIIASGHRYEMRRRPTHPERPLTTKWGVYF